MTRTKPMHLVTTAIEDTWPKNTLTPILFLGEWCKLHSRKSHWQNLDYSMLPYHWDDREKLDRDYHYLDGIYEKLIPIISNKLNIIHDVNYNTRYWRILIGPWLLYFIQILFDRWYMLQNVGRAGSVTIIDSGDNSFVPNDMEEFTSFYISDEWNEYLYSQIIVKQQLISTISKISPQKRVIIVKKSSLRSFVDKCINRVSKLFSKDENYFFYLDFIPFKTFIRVQLKLNQIPLFWRAIATPRVAIDPEKRKWSLNIEISDDFLSILSQLIPLQIPSVYLEGYSALKTLIKESEWPAKPKAIFTSNAYSADDYFKAWAAEKTSGGTSLIIGQHGGHFGTSPIESYAKHQYLIADQWLSWGWIKEGLSSIKPVGNLKIIKKSKLKYKPSGFALLVEAEYPRYSYNLYCVPISSQYIKYLENQYYFLNYLKQ